MGYICQIGSDSTRHDTTKSEEAIVDSASARSVGLGFNATRPSLNLLCACSCDADRPDRFGFDANATKFEQRSAHSCECALARSVRIRCFATKFEQRSALTVASVHRPDRSGFDATSTTTFEASLGSQLVVVAGSRPASTAEGFMLFVWVSFRRVTFVSSCVVVSRHWLVPSFLLPPRVPALHRD